MRKWISLCLVLCIVFSVMPVTAEASINCGDNVKWQLEGNTLRIYGKGRMCNRGDWPTTIQKVIIEEGVTTIAAKAFQNCTALTEVSIAGTVRSLGNYAFSGCTALGEIWLPDSVVVIAPYCFEKCTNLRNVRVGDRLIKLGEYAFADSGLENIVLPDSLLTLGSHAFMNSNIETIVVPGSVEFLYDGTFRGCDRLKNVYLEEGIKDISWRIFYDCDALEQIVFPESVEFLHNNAVQNCDNIKNVVFLGGYDSGVSGFAHAELEGNYTVWLPADDSCWDPTSDKLKYFADNVILIPYTRQGNTLVGTAPAEETVYDRLMEQKEKYPEGRISISSDYTLHVSYPDGRPIEAWFDYAESFAYQMSDACFGYLPTTYEPVTSMEQLRVGDVIWIGDIGISILLEVYEDHVVAASVNDTDIIEKTVSWSHVASAEACLGGYVLSRYAAENYTFQLPEARQPVISESIFPEESKTQSAPVTQPKDGYLNPFTDVKTDQFTEAILWAYGKKITTGTTDTTFSPEATCTRKQIVTFLWRYMGSPSYPTKYNPFTDVPEDRFCQAIVWANIKHITKGTSATTFSPEDPCTRKQIVTFLWRGSGSPEPASYENPFTDVPDDQFQKAILWAYHEGITAGTTATTFSPNAPCTRKQIVTFLWRFAGKPAVTKFADSTPEFDLRITSPIQVLHPGDTVQLEYFYTGDPGELEWVVSKNAPITVDQNGVVTALRTGKASVYLYGKNADGESTNVRRSIYVIDPPEVTATELNVIDYDGQFYDGMTAYVGGTRKLHVDLRSEDPNAELYTTCSNSKVISFTKKKGYYDGEYEIDIEYKGVGDAVMTFMSSDGTLCQEFRIHVEPYFPFEPFHRELLSPEEYVCYKNLAYRMGVGVSIDDTTTGYRWGGTTMCHELTYENAIIAGLVGNHQWVIDKPTNYTRFMPDWENTGDCEYMFHDCF